MADENNQLPYSSDREKTPPPYSADKEKTAAPEYPTEEHPTSSEIATSIYRPFPAFIQATGKWAVNREAFKTFKLCGKDENDFLYMVEINLGFKSGGIIDDRPGLILHNGTSMQAPVIAAACHQSITSVSFMDFDTQSIILLPKLPNQPGGPTHEDLAESRMLPRLTPDKNIALRFSVETGEKALPEEFEWRKCREQGIIRPSGFKLSRASTESATQSAVGASSTPKDDPNVLAVVTWPRAFSTTKLLFKLEFKGEGLTGVLGERWSLAVVITALKIWMLRLHGKLTKRGVKLAEQIHKALEDEGLA